MKQGLADAILVRYAEIGLKGKNRISFERQLIRNIKDFLEKEDICCSIDRKWGHIVIHTDRHIERIKDVFGVSSVSFAKVAEPDIDSIIRASDGFPVPKTFRVTARRSDKRLDFRSMDVEKELGAHLVKRGGKVSLKGYDVEFGVFIHDKAYIFVDKIKGVGGLPVGVEGRVLCLIDDDESLLAGWMMMKRGCDIAVYSREKQDISLLEKFYHRRELKLKMLSFSIEEAMRAERCKAIVSSKIFKTDQLLLTPTIGLDNIRRKIDSLMCDPVIY